MIASRRPRTLAATSLAVALLLGPLCGAQAQTVECEEPNVLLIFDVSGSMGAAKPGTKYTAAVAAIVAATTELDEDLRFGLLMFPDPEGMHCDLDPTPQIDFELGNGPAIFDLLDSEGANFYGGPQAVHDTPMLQALAAADELGALKTTERRSYVVLITDGNQDCCIAGDYDDDPDCLPNSTELDPVEADENIVDLVNQVSALTGANVLTFVVGLQDGVSAKALNKMAVAGQTTKAGCNPNQTNPAAPDNCYYTADDGLELQSALAAIAKIISEESCDGIDNDCDGDIDEDFPTLGDSCDGPDADLCPDGEMVCTVNTLSTICSESTPNNDEVCNDADDDCDGIADEDFAAKGDACDGPDPDQCKNGAFVCTNDGAALECDEVGSGLEETCNGDDDDCDGEVDEDEGMCPAGYYCFDGACSEEKVDDPDDLGSAPDAGSLPDVQDSPGDAGSATADTQDQPAPPDAGAAQPDAGPTGSADAGTDLNSRGGGATGPGAGGGDETDDSGCGCRQVGRSAPFPWSGGALVLALLGLLAATRRRRYRDLLWPGELPDAADARGGAGRRERGLALRRCRPAGRARDE